ncbi:methyltransferase domain-containing protein [Streptomyces sp. NPDC096079]
MTEAPHVTATRRSYDTVAVAYERLLADQLASAPLDRGVIAGFVEKVEAAGGPRTIGDLGCGTGRVTSHLRDLGADAFGLDLSPGMITVARAAYPGLRFDVGSMTALDLPDASLGGILSW